MQRLPVTEVSLLCTVRSLPLTTFEIIFINYHTCHVITSIRKNNLCREHVTLVMFNEYQLIGFMYAFANFLSDFSILTNLRVIAVTARE